MHRPARTFLLLLSLTLPIAAQSKTWHGTWSATVANGARVFSGTWDAAIGNDPDTVLGNWTVQDQAGNTLASGTWSARKHENAWTGVWQARGASGRLYSGTWRARSQLPADTRFAELFESALSKAVSGTWRMGQAYRGSWSIRAYQQP